MKIEIPNHTRLKEVHVDETVYYDGNLANFPSYYWHRVNGPAVIHHDGSWEWWQENECHRIDGPAIYMEKTKEYRWVVNGIDVTDEMTKWATESNIDLLNLTTEEKLIVKMKWAS